MRTIVKTTGKNLFVLVVGINIFHSFPNLFIKIDITSLADNAFYMLTEIYVKQVCYLIANVLVIFVSKAQESISDTPSSIFFFIENSLFSFKSQIAGALE